MRKSRPRSKSNHVSERSSESSGKSRQFRRAESKGSGKQKDGIKTEETSDEDEAINYPNNPPIQNGFVVFIHQVNFSSSSKEKRRVVEWISDALKMMNITPEVVTVDNLMEQSITVCSKPKSPVIKFARPVVENDTGTAKSDNSGPSSKSGGKSSNNKAMSPSRRKVSTAKSRAFSNPPPSSARSKSPHGELTREKSIHSSSSKALERKSGRPMKPQAIEDKKQEFGVQMSVLKDKVRKMQKENSNSVWVLLVESRKRCIVDMGKLNSLATRCRFKVRWIAAQAPRSLDQSVFSVVNDVVQTKNLCFPEQMRAIRRRTDSKSRAEKPKKAKNKPTKSNTVLVEVLHKALSKQFNVSSFASFDPNQFMDGGVMAEDELELTATDSDGGKADPHSYNSKEKVESSLESELRRLENGIVSEGSEKGPEISKHRDSKPQSDGKGHNCESPRKKEQQTNLNTETSKGLNICEASQEERLSKEINKEEGNQQNAVKKSTTKNDPRKHGDRPHKFQSVDSSHSTSNDSSSDELNDTQVRNKNVVTKVDATVGLALVDNIQPQPRVTTMLPGLSCSSTCRTYTKKSSIIRRSWDFNGNNNSNDIKGPAVVVFTRAVNAPRARLARILESLLEVNGISSYTLKVTELLTQPLASTRSSGKVSRSNSSQDLSAGCKRLIERGLSARLKEKSSHVIIVDVEDESSVNMWPIFNNSTKLGHKCLVLESSPDGTFEDNLEKVLRTIRLRLGQEQLDGVETLPEMPSLERTISSSSNASQSQKTPKLHQLKVDDDDCREIIKSQNNYSDTIWTVQSVQKIVSASKTPSGVASFTNSDNRVSDSNIYQSPSPLADTPPVEEGFDHSFSRVPSIYNVDDPSKAANMSASVEESAVFTTKIESDTQSSGANLSNGKEPPENLVISSVATFEERCQSADIEHNTERRHLGPEEPSEETENGNILVKTTLSLKPLSSRTVSGKNVQKGRRKDRSSSSSVRMRRRSSAKIRFTDGITIDNCKDCNSNNSIVVSKPGTDTSVAESTSSDEEHNVKPRKTSSSNSREAVRVSGVARRSKERLCEGSLLQIHRCETTKLGAGGTGSSMPEDDLFCGWVARARPEVKAEKRSVFIRTQSRLSGFFQRLCTCSRRRVGRAPRKLRVQQAIHTEPSPNNVARMHSFH